MNPKMKVIVRSGFELAKILKFITVASILQEPQTIDWDLLNTKIVVQNKRMVTCVDFFIKFGKKITLQ